MTYAGIALPVANASTSRPLIASYDLGFEYSQQHYIALQCMVEDADEEEASTLAHVPDAEEVAA